jgi:hypothetical protein
VRSSPPRHALASPGGHLAHLASGGPIAAPAWRRPRAPRPPRPGCAKITVRYADSRGEHRRKRGAARRRARGRPHQAAPPAANSSAGSAGWAPSDEAHSELRTRPPQPSSGLHRHVLVVEALRALCAPAASTSPCAARGPTARRGTPRSVTALHVRAHAASGPPGPPGATPRSPRFPASACLGHTRC